MQLRYGDDRASLALLRGVAGRYMVLRHRPVRAAGGRDCPVILGALAALHADGGQPVHGRL
jgi:hypothetical protein